MKSFKATKSPNPYVGYTIAQLANVVLTGKMTISYSAMPYLEAMTTLKRMDDTYGADDATSIVSYFLANATGMRGEVMRDVKAELNRMLKVYRNNK